MAQFDFATKQDLEKMKEEILLALIPLKSKTPEIPTSLTSKDVKKILQCKDSKLKYLRDTGKLQFVDTFGTYLYPREQFSILLSA
jgi:hypothetical protein